MAFKSIQKKDILKRKKPLCFYDSYILLADNTDLFRMDLRSFKLEFLGSIPVRKIYSLAGENRYLFRLLRSGVHNALHANGKIYLVCDRTLYSFDPMSKVFSIELVFTRGKGPLSMTCIDNNLGTFEPGIYYGEYFNNPGKDEVNIFFKSTFKNEWFNLYSFPKGQVNHIHAIIPDYFRNLMWILTGDFGDAATIWVADNNFKTVTPVSGGDQRYRACVAFPVRDGIIYATDSQAEKNYICHLYKDENGWNCKELHEINGSCIYGCKVEKYYVFSTSTEPGVEKNNSFLCSLLNRKPGPGILKNESHLIILDENMDIQVIDKKEKDEMPYILFQFGTLMFPSGENNTKYLFSYNVANKGNDLSTEIWEIA
jgi:hypothetical protein